MSDLVERIRAWDAYELSGPAPDPVHLSECAAEIEALRAENARLREALEKIALNEPWGVYISDQERMNNLLQGWALARQ